MDFRDREKERYEDIRDQGAMSALFSDSATSMHGLYNKKKPYPFCLADKHACENLYQGIRADALQYFDEREIKWHDGLYEGKLPSNHLCCSQSCCVNFLFPLVRRRDLVESIFGYFYPDMERAQQINKDRRLPDGALPYMAFEWIGSKDYLQEQKRKGRQRTRGAYYTSTDFAFKFRRNDKKIQLVLGEWKYTEEYREKDLGKTIEGGDTTPEARKHNYRDAFNRKNGTFSGHGESLYDALFFEPFYQLMRLQLMDQEMEYGSQTEFGLEMGADVVSVLHVCPEVNREFRERVTSPHLAGMFPESGTLEIWKELVPEDKFMSISVEELLDTIIERAKGSDREWVDYLVLRYGWERDFR